VLRVLIGLTRQAQLNLRVVLAGRDFPRLTRVAGAGRLLDEASGLLRDDVKAWLVTRGIAEGAPLDSVTLEAELNGLFPLGESPDPTQLRIDIADTARRLWP
jgi:hypothetical protein